MPKKSKNQKDTSELEKKAVAEVMEEKAEKDLKEGKKPETSDASKSDKAILKNLKRVGRFQLVDLGKGRYTVVNKELQRVCPISEGNLGYTYCNKLVTKFNLKDPEQKKANKGKGTWSPNDDSPAL